MSIEFLEEKKKAIETVIQAHRDFQKALKELPVEWQSEVLEGSHNGPPYSVLVNKKDSKLAELQTPSNAVLALLGKHPGGLGSRQIVRELEGKIKTTSDNQYRLLYSTIATLKRAEKIQQGHDKRFRL